MQNQDQIDYDAIIRRAEAMRAEAVVEMTRALMAFFRRKPAVKPLLG
jgi:hypothetical protein